MLPDRTVHLKSENYSREACDRSVVTGSHKSICIGHRNHDNKREGVPISGRPFPTTLCKALGARPKVDKSVLAISEPKRIRSKEHLRFVASQPCLICERSPAQLADGCVSLCFTNLTSGLFTGSSGAKVSVCRRRGIGFGIVCGSSRMRVPRPPQKRIVLMVSALRL